MDTAKRRPRAYHPGLRLRGSYPPRVGGRPQHEIKSDRTDHIAAHKSSALRLVDD